MKCKNLMRRSCKRKGYKNTLICKTSKIWNPKCNVKCEDYIKKETTYLKAKTELKKASKKYAKSERERESIFTDDLKTCIECGRKEDKYIHVDTHECFRGARRSLSKKWKLCIPLCSLCHDKPKIEHKWQVLGQLKFINYYNKTEEEFVNIFKINFVKRYPNL
jgi:hypothetical protein